MSQDQSQPQMTVEQRISEFILAVDQALTEAGVPAEERENVKGDLRVQIEEMLSARRGETGKAVTLEDVEAVLAELDPPQSYSEGAGAAEPQRTDREEDSCGGRRNWRQRHHGGPRWFWRRRHVADAIRQAIGAFSPFGNPAFAGMTDRSRKALSLAKAEARNANHEYIGTEHLLLGLILEGTGVAGIVLADLGVDANKARQEISKLVPPGKMPVTAERLPLTPRLRQAFEEARLAARKLHHDYLGTEHLLMGLMDVPGVAVEAIKALGLNPQQVKDAILQRIPAWTHPETPGSFTYWPASAAQTTRIAGNEYRIIAGGTDTGGAYAIVEATISRADGLGLRTHPREDISLYILDGGVQLRIDQRTVALAKGDFARIPRGTAHEILPGDSPARAMLIAAPAGFEKLLGYLGKAPDAQTMRQAAMHYGLIVEAH
jgi:quercetin dioxygenase-like cupin family protein